MKRRAIASAKISLGVIGLIGLLTYFGYISLYVFVALLISILGFLFWFAPGLALEFIHKKKNVPGGLYFDLKITGDTKEERFASVVTQFFDREGISYVDASIEYISEQIQTYFQSLVSIYAIASKKTVLVTNDPDFIYKAAVYIVAQDPSRLLYRFDGRVVGCISAKLKDLHREIEDSAKQFLYYKAPDEESEIFRVLPKTWITAMEILVRICEGLLDQDVIISEVDISPSGGDVDIELTASEYVLSLHIKENSLAHSYYWEAEDSESEDIEFSDSSEVIEVFAKLLKTNV